MDRLRLRLPPAPDSLSAGLRRWAGNLAAIGLLLLAAWSSRAPAQTGVDVSEAAFHTSDIANPLDPLAQIPADANTRARATIALLPDPVDTRLGRSFDIQVSTLIRGFQFDGYVLQGHALPWQLPEGDGKAPSRAHETTPGVLLFRNDRWRDPATGTPSVDYFVVFLVGESPVFGIQRLAFCKAARRVMQIQSGQAGAADDASCTPAPPGAAAVAATEPAPIPVLGPMFSGSMTSLAEVAMQANLHVNLISPSATVDSNGLLTLAPAARGRLTYQSVVTWQQHQQLTTLFDYLYFRFKLCPNRVVILAEQSSFGQGAQYIPIGPYEDRNTRCAGKLRPQLMQFPQNVAAIRAEHARLDAQREANRKNRDAVAALVPRRNMELDMQEVGDSRDLPPVYQASLTSRSDELSLQQLMDQLAVRTRPKAVLVVASDVRDRLYMLDVVRQAVPAALPVALEGDHLLSHPDYRGANRGTLMLPHTRLQLCYAREQRKDAWKECRWSRSNASSPRSARARREVRRFYFATDYAAGLFRATQVLLHPEVKDLIESNPDASRRIAVVTLAGTQSLNFPRPPDGEDAGDSSGSNGTLIATQWRTLSANFLVPILWATSTLLLAASLWLWRSSRPGRTILPPLRHALRETEWALRQAGSVLRGRRPTPRRQPSQPRHDRTSARVLVLLVVLSMALFATLSLEWLRVLAVAGSTGIGLEGGNSSQPFRAYMRLIHGRDLLMAVVLFGLYSWLILLAAARISAWNHRCRRHWADGERHPGRNPHARRSFQGPSLLLALLLALPPLLAWHMRDPVTVDNTTATTLMAFAILVACLYLLIQSFLQSQRLVSLARDICTLVMDGLPKGLIAADWPNPSLLHLAPGSPMTVVFGDRDWHALDLAGEEWPLVTRPAATGDWKMQFRGDELRIWQERTVAELKFGLVCVRTCLWAAFLAPVTVLAMIHVHPFSFEWEHRTIALIMLVVAFAASTYITFRAEQAPLIGQMFTRDGAKVSFFEVLKAMGGKALVALPIVLTTLSPDVGQWLQGLLGMMKF